MTAVPLVDPAGHAYPALHAPSHNDDDDSPLTDPKRPAGRGTQPATARCRQSRAAAKRACTAVGTHTSTCYAVLTNTTYDCCRVGGPRWTRVPSNARTLARRRRQPTHRPETTHGAQPATAYCGQPRSAAIGARWTLRAPTDGTADAVLPRWTLQAAGGEVGAQVLARATHLDLAHEW